MEIHPPRHVGSIKEFLRELVVITSGILIALSLEGLLEWKDHRELAHEARANIITELRENRRELSKEQQDIGKMQTQGQSLIDLVHRLEVDRKAPVHEFGYIFSLAELHSTSWDTAKATGAIQYLPYAEVKRYTEVYDLQQDFESLEQRGFTASLDVEGLITLLQRSKAQISPAELEDAERRLGIAWSDVNAMDQFSTQLAKRYDELLKSVSHD